MVKSVIILSEVIFSEHHIKRLGAFALAEHFQVFVLDLTPWIRPDFWRLYQHTKYPITGYREICSHNELLQILDSIGNSALAFDYLGSGKQQELVRNELKDRSIYRAVFTLGVVPEAMPLRGIKRLNGLWHKKIIIRFWIKLKKWLVLEKKISPPDIIFCTGSLSMARVQRETKHVVQVHDIDYDAFLELGPSQSSSRPFGVFLDENLVYHSDYDYSFLVSPTSEKEYFHKMKHFFDIFESITCMEIKIALHPRSRYEDPIKNFGKREIINGRTAELVRDSQIVFVHASTSIAFAALWRKPIVFLTDNNIEKNWYGEEVRARSRYFDAPTLNLDRFEASEIDITNWNRVNERMCEEYVKKFIKIPGSPERPLWAIVSDFIERRL